MWDLKSSGLILVFSKLQLEIYFYKGRVRMTSELVSLLYSLNPISLFLSLSHFCNICPDPMEIIIIKERERERKSR